MESLRIKSRDIYKIEVNDNGDCIEFDLADIGTKVKLYESLDKIEEISKRYQEKINEIKSDKELALLEENMFKDMRVAMDYFLGENACQKIFGDRNYYEMFNDLMRELSRKRPELKGKSHLDMLKLDAESIRNRIMQKYDKKKKNVI